MDEYGYEDPDRFIDLSSAAALVRLRLAGISRLFNLWMIIDAIRKREWAWVAYDLHAGTRGGLVFLLHVSRPTTRGFELPGASDRAASREPGRRRSIISTRRIITRCSAMFIFKPANIRKREACHRAADGTRRALMGIHARTLANVCLRQTRARRKPDHYSKGVARKSWHDYNHTAMASTRKRSRPWARRTMP